MQNYTTQMDAARKGIVPPEMEIVAKKEYRTTERSVSWWLRARWPFPPTSTTPA